MFEPCLFDHPCKLILRGELADALDKVLVAFFVISYILTDERNDVKRVEVVDVFHKGVDMREFETHEATPTTEYTVCFSECFVSI